jgi:tetratricopeptide (TPR) repeat protein
MVRHLKIIAVVVLVSVFSVVTAEAQNVSDLDPSVVLEDKVAETQRSLGLASFRDGELGRAIEELKDAIRISPNDESSFLLLADILLVSGLTGQAEAVLVLAVDAIPDSQLVQYRLGDLYANSGRMRRSLEGFERASELDGDIARDQVYMRVGNVQTVLAQFDKAESAYRTALELNSASVETRLGLGNMYFRSNRFDDALIEYGRVALERPGTLAAHYRLAEVNLRLDRFEESIAAADKALEIDPQYRQARYLLGRALIRVGQSEAGQRELEEYRKLEARSQAREHRITELFAFSGGAMARLRDGQPEEALELLRRGIEVQPDVASLYLGLGLTEIQMGRHREAVETFETMIRLGLDADPILYSSLALEYEVLGDIRASQRSRAIYMERTRTGRALPD